jgi:group I intron endonuclease
MTNETHGQNRIIYFYRITNLINKKVYIGQSVDPTSRWRAHRRDSAEPKVPIQFAIKKHGAHNFEFEVIASCKTQDDANETETELVRQYDSFVTNGKGYNATHGGMNAPKSELWKQAMRDWHASLSSEERAAISKKQSESFTKYIKENGHIALGTKRTPEQLKKMSQIRLANPVDYTPEKRQHMSEAHIGIKDTEETKKNKSDSAKVAWSERISYDGIKCHALGCEVAGKAKYKIIDNVRYCNKHGLRILRYGRLDRIKPLI